MGIPRAGSLAGARRRPLIALDSNVLIDLLRQQPIVRSRFDQARGTETALFTSVICLEEVLFGIARARGEGRRERATLAALLTTLEVLPFETADAETAARARAQMVMSGKPPPQIDLLIGAHALSRGLSLVTANTRDFANIPGLALLDWTRPPDDPQD